MSFWLRSIIITKKHEMEGPCHQSLEKTKTKNIKKVFFASTFSAIT
jgi:hypothetical protein